MFTILKRHHFIPNYHKAASSVLLLTIFLSLGFSEIPGWAAEGLFSVEGGYHDLSAQIQKAQPNPTIVRSRFAEIDFGHLSRSLLPEPDESISLNLFEDVFFVARKDRMEWRSRDQFSWFGHIEGEENSHVILVVENGTMAGNITFQGKIYHVRFTQDRIHAIQEIDQSGFQDETRPIRVESPRTSEDYTGAGQDSCGTIDVLVVYTADALAGAGSTTAMNTQIQLAIDETNQSYINSNITQRVKLVHSEQVNYREAGVLCNDAGSDLDRLQDPGDGYMDNVHALRNTYGADIVVLLVEYGGSSCGCAFIQDTVSTAFASHAFAVVKRDCATGYYSFGHEMGHIMGANHDWYMDTSTTPYAYGHGYVYKPGKWRSIMAYNEDCLDSGYSCTRIQYWSNPLVNYGGIPTGVSEGGYHAADNHKTLNNTACTVANFGQSRTTGVLYFPHVDTTSGWQTEIAIINTNPNQSVTGTLRALSNTGQLVETKPVTLSAHGRRQITVANEFTNHTNIGYIIYDADSDTIQGYIKFYKQGKYRAAIPAVKDVNYVNTSNIYIPHIDSGIQWWTGLSLVNTTSEMKNITITFNTGEIRTITLNANEHKPFLISSLFNDQPSPSIQSAVITNATGIIGLEVFGTYDDKRLEGILLTDKTALTLYYPHVAGGDWRTGIVAYNPSESACTLTITPYNSQGTAFSSSSLSLPGKSKYAGFVTALGLPAQTAWFKLGSLSKLGSTCPLTGFELFATVDDQQLAAYAGGGGTGAKTGVFPQD